MTQVLLIMIFLFYFHCGGRAGIIPVLLICVSYGDIEGFSCCGLDMADYDVF